MTAPAQIAFTVDGKRAGIRAHGRVAWLPDDFTAPLRALQDEMDRMNRTHDMWRQMWLDAEEAALNQLADERARA